MRFSQLLVCSCLPYSLVVEITKAKRGVVAKEKKSFLAKSLGSLECSSGASADLEQLYLQNRYPWVPDTRCKISVGRRCNIARSVERVGITAATCRTAGWRRRSCCFFEAARPRSFFLPALLFLLRTTITLNKTNLSCLVIICFCSLRRPD